MFDADTLVQPPWSLLLACKRPLQRMAGGDIDNVDGRIYNPHLWVGELVTMTLAAAPLSRSKKMSK